MNTYYLIFFFFSNLEKLISNYDLSVIIYYNTIEMINECYLCRWLKCGQTIFNIYADKINYSPYMNTKYAYTINFVYASYTLYHLTSLLCAINFMIKIQLINLHVNPYETTTQIIIIFCSSSKPNTKGLNAKKYRI